MPIVSNGVAQLGGQGQRSIIVPTMHATMVPGGGGFDPVSIPGQGHRSKVNPGAGS